MLFRASRQSTQWESTGAYSQSTVARRSPPPGYTRGATNSPWYRVVCASRGRACRNRPTRFRPATFPRVGAAMYRAASVAAKRSSGQSAAG